MLIAIPCCFRSVIICLTVYFLWEGKGFLFLFSLQWLLLIFLSNTLCIFWTIRRNRYTDNYWLRSALILRKINFLSNKNWKIPPYGSATLFGTFFNCTTIEEQRFSGYSWLKFTIGLDSMYLLSIPGHSLSSVNQTIPLKTRICKDVIFFSFVITSVAMYLS